MKMNHSTQVDRGIYEYSRNTLFSKSTASMRSVSINVELKGRYESRAIYS